jgi:hypothetical protein
MTTRSSKGDHDVRHYVAVETGSRDQAASAGEGQDAGDDRFGNHCLGWNRCRRALVPERRGPGAALTTWSRVHRHQHRCCTAVVALCATALGMGYWKPIGPLEFGNDRDGTPVVGRTWVVRHESWSARSPQSFVLEQPTKMVGPDPGVVYVQRSESHENNVYKIGLTRRNAEVRASKLSAATGVPLPFFVLAQWEVGDCSQVEREVHGRLADFRINPNREFFFAELSQICRTINEVVAELPRTETMC